MSSLVAQLVNKPPAMRETWVQSLGWEVPLEKLQWIHLTVPEHEPIGVCVSITLWAHSGGEHNMRDGVLLSPQLGSQCLSSYEHFTLQSVAPGETRGQAHFMQHGPPGLLRHEILQQLRLFELWSIFVLYVDHRSICHVRSNTIKKARFQYFTNIEIWS